MLSLRENFNRLLRCEIPEYVPTYSIFWGARPSFYNGRKPDGTGVDVFGVEWVIDGSAVQAALPKPGVFILDDVRKWRDVIKAPDYSGVDWEAAAKKDLENYDPTMPRGGSTAPSAGFFQGLMAFMGFTNGLMACFEEPEEVKALNEYLCDFAVENGKRMIEFYKPDFGMLADDIAHEMNPFLSLEMFQELFAPYWRRYIKVWLDEGLPGMHHNCGHFEEYLDDLVDMGFSGWDPVQDSNDEVGIKAKYGNKLALCGAWIGKRPGAGMNEEEVRANVKNTLDTLAPGGGYAFLGGGAPPTAAPEVKQRSEWILDEFEKLRYSYYK